MFYPTCTPWLLCQPAAKCQHLDTVSAPAAGNTATTISYSFYIPSLSISAAVPVIAAASAAVVITVHIIAIAGTIAAVTAVSVIKFSAVTILLVHHRHYQCCSHCLHLHQRCSFAYTLGKGMGLPDVSCRPSHSRWSHIHWQARKKT